MFENHVLIFSDKACDFPNLEDEGLAWRRWYKRAILKSAHQVWGAERWIREHPDRLFLDRACTKAFPIELPNAQEAHIHRVVVAHDLTGRRKRMIGGTGSLLVNPQLSGDDHLTPRAAGGQPFAIGQIDPRRGYVHVFDDASLGRVLRTLDTITDFVTYLTRKEQFVASGRLFGAFGEEDLLAYYLKNTNAAGEHDFVLPGRGKVLLEEGHWSDFIRRPELERKLAADRISYLWDGIIEEFAGHAVAGTLQFSTIGRVSDHERMLRVLAREPRVRRRILAQTLLEKVTDPIPPGHSAFRIIKPSKPGDPYYVLVVSAVPGQSNEIVEPSEAYRHTRRELLEGYCLVTMNHYKNAECVIGIGTESGTGRGRSHDLLKLEREDWTDELAAQAKEIQNETGWLRQIVEHRTSESEYPNSLAGKKMESVGPRKRRRR